MNIIFKKKKLGKIFNDDRLLKKEYGKVCGELIRDRMDDFRAVESLSDLNRIPPARCHPLTGNMKGKFAVDVQHPYRIIFEPAEDPLPLNEDGGIDLNQVKNIRILEVKDYHGD